MNCGSEREADECCYGDAHQRDQVEIRRALRRRLLALVALSLDPNSMRHVLERLVHALRCAIPALKTLCMIKYLSAESI